MCPGTFIDRKHPHHEIIELTGKPTVIFVTIGLENRAHGNLATPELHDLLRNVWIEATGWSVNWYMIMPDHIHYFTTPGTMDISLRRWIQYCKSQYTRAHLPGAPRFEIDYWDTKIRSAQHYAEKWAYMRDNPLRKQLVTHPDEWPYQGVIHEYVWMEI